jgi:hypothetical protein
MDLIKIPFLIIGIIFGAVWTVLLFAGAAVTSLSAMLVVMIFAPFTLFFKNADLAWLRSWVRGPVEWAIEKSSNLWENLFRNISAM